MGVLRGRGLKTEIAGSINGRGRDIVTGKKETVWKELVKILILEGKTIHVVKRFSNTLGLGHVQYFLGCMAKQARDGGTKPTVQFNGAKSKRKNHLLLVFRRAS